MYYLVDNATTLNPSLTGTPALMSQATDYTDGEKAIEFGGRVCYNSITKMGTAPEFIANCMRNEHYDVAEHGHAVLFVAEDKKLLDKARFLNTYEWDKNFYVSGNLRAWHDFLIDYPIRRRVSREKLRLQLARV